MSFKTFLIKISTLVLAALEFLLSNVKTDFNKTEFEKACGAGVTISPEQIEQCVEKVIEKFKDELIKNR